MKGMSLLPAQSLLPEINPAEVLRYLGCRCSCDDLLEQIRTLSAEILCRIRPRTVFREFQLNMKPHSVEIVGATMALPGNDIRNLLANCHHAVFFAVTLGMEMDSFLRQKQLSNMGDALVLDACLSAAIDAVCNNLRNSVQEQYAAQNCFLTAGFSPGYGDLPISLQQDFLALLDAQRKIGLTCTSESILIPQKSVTGLWGIADSPGNTAPSRCNSCSMHGKCPYQLESSRPCDPLPTDAPS